MLTWNEKQRNTGIVLTIKHCLYSTCFGPYNVTSFNTEQLFSGIILQSLELENNMLLCHKKKWEKCQAFYCLLLQHSSEIIGLCLMKLSSETLQMVQHKLGHWLLQIQSCSKWKRNNLVVLFQKYGKFWSVLLDHFI